MLSQERADIITSILTEDLERAKEISSLDAEKAVEEFNRLRPGNNFTLDELVEYSKSARELGLGELDEVAGGFGVVVVIVVAGAVAVAVVGG